MKNRTPFSLVELLVVIAIIAIMASLILPGLQLSREKAKQVACKSNMKQIYMADIMYQDDNDDIVGLRMKYGWDHIDGGNGAAKWPAVLKAYLTGTPWDADGWQPQSDVRYAEVTCPSTGFQEKGTSPDYNANVMFTHRSWSLNDDRHMLWFTKLKITGRSSGAANSSFTSDPELLAYMPILVDGYDRRIDPQRPLSVWNIRYGSSGEPSGRGLSHANQSNVLYFDGRVSQVGPTESERAYDTDALPGTA